jgi:adenosylhomocysteine nucleosidase
MRYKIISNGFLDSLRRTIPSISPIEYHSSLEAGHGLRTGGTQTVCEWRASPSLLLDPSFPQRLGKEQLHINWMISQGMSGNVYLEQYRKTHKGNFMSNLPDIRVAVIISANVEWNVVLSFYPDAEMLPSPFGEWFMVDLDSDERVEPALFFHGGWGKIAAAASAQYIIDHWSPELLINLGTCGGFDGEIEKGTIIMVERTIVYDIIEQMTGGEAAIAHYSTDIDLSWLGDHYPHEVLRTLLVSADRDQVVEEIPQLKSTFGAVAGDWESGAIAFVAQRNMTRCLILRGVTDLVGKQGSEAYGDVQVFIDGTTSVLRHLIDALPAWIALWERAL